MKIAAAQTKPSDHDMDANIMEHLHLVDQAAENGVKLILFPEMSLTGYQMERAAELSYMSGDERLEVLRKKAAYHHIFIVAGAPVRINEHLHIGAFVFSPDGSEAIYTKKYLHTGEEKFFSPSLDFDPVLTLDNFQASVAICADITNPEHPRAAAATGSNLYLAGIFYTPGGIGEAYEQLSHYAKTYNISVLMANYGGPSYKFESAGQSAFWDKDGQLVSHLATDEQGLMVVEITR